MQLKHKPPIANIINMSSLTKHEQFILDNAAATNSDPSELLDRKIEHLTEILDCSEEEAERV